MRLKEEASGLEDRRELECPNCKMTSVFAIDLQQLQQLDSEEWFPVTVCRHCHMSLHLGKDLKLRKVTEDEWLQLSPSQREGVLELRDYLITLSRQNTEH